MKYLTLTAAATALLFAPATANAQFFGSGLDNSSVLGGLGGAGIGGALGSRIAGSGNRTEGAAIGAVLGGLAGTSYGNSQSSYYGNPYAGSFNPGFSGNSLLGTTAGAGIGGVIGSNLAGRGQRQEGTAIGAVVGGLAGYALTNRSSRYGNQGVGGGNFGGGNYIPAGYGGSNFGVGGFAAPTFGASVPQFGTSLPPVPLGGRSFVPGGFVNVGTFANTQTIQPAPKPIYIEKVIRQPAPRPAPPQTIVVKHRYVAPAPAPQQVIVRHVYEQAPAPAPQQQVVVSHEYYNAPTQTAPVAPTIAPAPDAGAGGSYLVTAGQPFHAPSAGEVYEDCATTTFGCASSKKSKSKDYNWTQKSHRSAKTYGASSGNYSYCDSDKVYNDDGALLLNASPVCR